MATKSKLAKSEKKGLRRQGPAEGLASFDLVDHWFDQLERRGWLSPFHWDWHHKPGALSSFIDVLPKVDVIDREKEILVRAELPGVDKDDLEVTLADHAVTIKASTRSEEKEEDGEYFRQEMTRGEFRRTVTLPQDITEEGVKATMRDGMLELTLPKVETAPQRKVKVE